LKDTKGIKPSLDANEISGILCRDCNKTIDIEDAHIKCDNCGNNIPRDESKKFGGTISLCSRCVNSCRSFEIFKIFGSRGPTGVKRKSRITSAVREAQEIRPEIPEALVSMYEGEELEASDSDSPFDGEVLGEDAIVNFRDQEVRIRNYGTINSWTNVTSNTEE
jgi:hypothetical protein